MGNLIQLSCQTFQKLVLCMKLFMHKTHSRLEFTVLREITILLTLLKRTYVRTYVPKYRSNSTLFSNLLGPSVFDRIQNISKNFERSFHAKISPYEQCQSDISILPFNPSLPLVSLSDPGMARSSVNIHCIKQYLKLSITT